MMSRGDQRDVQKEAKTQNTAEFENSQNSYKKAQTGINDYESELANYSASDPYQSGGEFETAEDQQIGNTADSTAASARNELQTQALRTGANSEGAIAASESVADQMERNSAAQRAAAEEARIGSEESVKTNVLQGKEDVPKLEAGLSGEQGGAANSALGVQANASATPGFWDTFGDSFAHAIGNTLGGGNLKVNANMNIPTGG